MSAASPPSLVPAPVLPAIPRPAAALTAPPEAPAFAGLRAALPASDAAPESVFSAGRLAFDGQPAAADDAAVPAALSAPTATLAAPPPTAALRAAVSAPAPLVAAAHGAVLPWEYLAAVAGAVLLVFLLDRALRRRREPATFRPRLDQLPPPTLELESLRVQATELVAVLAESTRYLKKPRDVREALDRAWREAVSDQGVERRVGEELRRTPIAPEVFEAIDMPRILDENRRREVSAELWFPAISDALTGLSREPERARSPQDLLDRLGWWKRHFTQWRQLQDSHAHTMGR